MLSTFTEVSTDFFVHKDCVYLWIPPYLLLGLLSPLNYGKKFVVGYIGPCMQVFDQGTVKLDNRKPDIRKISIYGQKQLLYKVRSPNPDIEYL
jgi:hypothetical protein